MSGRVLGTEPLSAACSPSAPPWGAAPHCNPTAQGSSSGHPHTLGEYQALPTSRCKHHPAVRLRLKQGEAGGVTNNAYLRGFSACARKPHP